MSANSNPDNLTHKQIGEGWRLAKHDERPHAEAQVWWRLGKKWTRSPEVMLGKPYETTCTYRVPDYTTNTQ